MRLQAEPLAAGVDTLEGLLVKLTPSLRATTLKAEVNTLARFVARESRSAADYERNQEHHEQNHLRYLL